MLLHTWEILDFVGSHLRNHAQETKNLDNHNDPWSCCLFHGVVHHERLAPSTYESMPRRSNKSYLLALTMLAIKKMQSSWVQNVSNFYLCNVEHFICIKLVIGNFASAFKDGKMRCIQSERQAFLKFKEGLVNYDGHLSSSGSEEEKEDWCKWTGVRCSSQISHIVMLQQHGFGVKLDEVSLPNITVALLPSINTSRSLSIYRKYFGTCKDRTSTWNKCHQEDGDKLIVPRFCFRLGLGFAFGFCGVCGTPFLSDPCRYASFKLLNAFQGWTYLTATISMARQATSNLHG
ncbi:hypothetical protein RJ639_020778 [Escallonia herrerae]|uniref:Leucine-rich repeat-containing N-terminal plant-type domain-containing protein n=1 Tax=Escallonia herrerae TaxID=1293975 RepID=A0AA88V7W8_9ASTE|nr:hypothetical protein RJ639_020778 [Escallonia herrerae]